MSSYNTNFNVGDNDKRIGTIIPSHIWHRDDYGSTIMPILELAQINNLINIINDLDNRISSLESNVTYQSHSIQLVLNSQNANVTSPITQDVFNSNYAEWGITVQPGYEVIIVSDPEDIINNQTTGYQGQGWTTTTEFIEWRIQTRTLRDSDKPNITIEIATRVRDTYLLTFNENGGSIPINPWHVYQNFAILLPTYTGQYDTMHEFAGWTTERNGSTVYPASSSFTVYGDTTLYAKWKDVVLYNIQYNLNFGSGTTPSSETVKEGNSIILPSGNGISRSGYTFKGWNTSSDGTGTHLTAGSTYTPSGGVSYTTITLYAEWEAVSTSHRIILQITGDLRYGVEEAREQNVENGHSFTWHFTVENGYRLSTAEGSSYVRTLNTYQNENAWYLETKTMNESYDSTIYITVNCSQQETANSITISSSSLTMYTGATASISANVGPSTASNRNVKWQSSNTSIVDFTNNYDTASGVSKVLVAGSSEGDAIITAIAAGNTSIQATCNVRVNGRTQTVIPVNSVTVSPSGTINVTVGETTSFTYNTNSDATEKRISWVPSDSNAISLSTSETNATSGTIIVTGLREGTGVITVTPYGQYPILQIGFNCTQSSQPSANTYLYIGTERPTASNISSLSSNSILYETTKPEWTVNSKGSLNVTTKDLYWMALPVSWGNITLQYGAFPTSQANMDDDTGEVFENIMINGVEHIVRRFVLGKFTFDIWF